MSSRVPREYLLAVTSGRIVVVGTKVFELSPLSIARSNRLARLNVKLGISPLCLQISFCINIRTTLPRLYETQNNGGACVGLRLPCRLVFRFGGYRVFVSDSASLTKYTGLWAGRACPSSFLSTTMAALATWSVATT